MIDYIKLEENFRYYSKEVVIKIIDLYLDGYNERIETIHRNLKENDLEKLKFNAHSLKGVISTFMDNDAFALAGELEARAINMEIENLEELFVKLQMAAMQLFLELTVYKEKLIQQ
jgi:HPt (histidine-containing phosphotransfer) domain-containing protein